MLNNHPCQVRPKLVDINSNEPRYSFTVTVNKCGGSCNTINDLYAKTCNPNMNVKNVDVKVFNLMLGVSETRFCVNMYRVSVNIE